ncbi:hypothetical protein ALQ72_02659 [Pseudomonas syringae pv. maculicola]|uniref:Uncharacterized protein n=1 Tax=Pseudomonas syringae pv. maculicola TaxID=59511 RepID=A0A0N0G8K7_PSEYM|nr:hypothetical protein [Pseudomonas syringae group genomosp. 3]KPC18233.1 Uncharacterized protein Precursor [Pseudomonas syringae pv. maculicola]MBM0209894.1 hypothetical protein [Pseudomonas syringae pv. maculicola]RMM78368.1 hypothetical protein ALQ72_02659 [Pseudomonas syringae pv. maculicola]RMV39429.1 hypothetical protein ALP13_03020 [Pseudomonas syringae pv. maculicola]
MGIYKDVMGTLVRVLAADNIDNSTKQSWQKLIDADLRMGGNGSSISVRDKFDYDCCLYALLHRELESGQWDVLVAKYSTHKANKVAAIGRLVSRTTSPAPQLFVYKALTAWAIPKLRGIQTGKRSTDMIVLPAEFYDMNSWDKEGKPESTRRRWRTGIAKRLESLEEAAVIRATEIFDREQIFIDAA